jgi:regulator of protease activity HflC (stomatin/prohibitin superfamily)
MVNPLVIIVSVIVALLLVFLIASGIRVIRPYETGLYMFLGKYRGKLHSGLNLVIPFGSSVIRLDTRTQTIDVPRQEVITKDNSPVNVDAIVYLKIVNPEDAYFKVQDYADATISLAQTNLRSLIGEMDLDEILSSREVINAKIRDSLDQSTEAWGVKIEAVEIREVDPVERVKRAMEEQTSAEREKRAAIQRAEGERQSAILRAQGVRESLVLEAQAERESQVLRAQGRKEAAILEAQGQARALQVLGVGALALDSRAMAYLGLQTLEKVGSGPSSKWIIPVELTKALQGVAGHFGAQHGDKPHVVTLEELKKLIPNFDTLMAAPSDVKVIPETSAAAMQAKVTRDAEVAAARKAGPPRKSAKAE